MAAVILAFDTSTALTSVAVVTGGEVVVEHRHLDARGHAEVLGPLFALVRAHIDPSDVDAVACGVGPGPYTGLRVGIASALAVGAAWHRPVYGVCSLDAVAAAGIAAAGRSPSPLCVAADARRAEVYWAAYSAEGVRHVGPRVSRPLDIDPVLRAGRWIGHGAAVHADEFGTVGIDAGDDSPRAYPSASWIGRLASDLLAAGAEIAGSPPLDAHGQDTGSTSRSLGGAGLLLPRPLYLRRPDAVAAGGGA